jgi:type II secretory pathway pseudopilin PulG
MRRAITLVELLVVISIIVMLMITVLPRVCMDSETRRINNAARVVATVLKSAQYRAIETGRPCGVTLVEDSDNPGAAWKLQQVEVPPYYSGETPESQVTVNKLTTAGSFARLRLTTSSLELNANLVHQGDRLRLNHQSHWFVVQQVNESSGIVQLLIQTRDPTQSGDLPEYPFPVSFEVTRQPIPTVDEPTILPGKTAVDLVASGWGRKMLQYGGNLTLLFHPSGRLSKVYYKESSGRVEAVPAEDVFLLVGLINQTPDPTSTDSLRPRSYVSPTKEEAKKPNWQRLASRWVKVQVAYGTVKWDVNATSPTWDAAYKAGNPKLVEDGIIESRSLAGN